MRLLMFTNYYDCPRCHFTWNDTWSCACDDDCPDCSLRHISPYDSDEDDE